MKLLIFKVKKFLIPKTLIIFIFSIAFCSKNNNDNKRKKKKTIIHKCFINFSDFYFSVESDEKIN